MKKINVLHSSQLNIQSIQQIIKILLDNRGIKTKKEIQEFLNPKIEKISLDTVGIDKKEIKKTLSLIKKTIKEKKAIAIYGDYDVDGICGTAILWETIYEFYKDVYPYIPHRIDEGYGLSIKGIEKCKKQNEKIGLIITVDNGIVANSAVSFANSNGIKVIITDHHTKGSKLPKAEAIVHTTELCGTGVAFLLSKELFTVLSSQFSEKTVNPEPLTDNHLELVALATVADLVPLNKYNRALIKFGLEALHKTNRVGLFELFREAKLDQKKIGVYEIGHMIAPRLNASGRISHALDSLRLICTKDKARAKKLADELGIINRERQQITMDSSLDAIQRVRGEKVGSEGGGEVGLVFVESVEYEQGVIGLIASRLVEEFYRPAIAVSVGEKVSKGSARSIKGIDIIEMIRSSSDFLTEAGGHPMAAGFSIKTERLKDFKNKMISLAEKLDNNLFERILTVDLELPFELISDELYQEIQQLAPFGMGNPQPVFLTKRVTVAGLRKVGRDEKHLKLILQKNGLIFNAILFAFERNQGINIGDIIDIVYTVELNSWNNQEKIELKIKDLSVY